MNIDFQRKRLSELVERFTASPVDIASLAAFRILFGSMMAAAMIRFLAKGWVTQFYVAPKYYFSYPGFAWVHPWPDPWMHVHFILLAALALGIAFGCFYRFCAALFFLGFTYVELIDQTNYLNHYYLISLLSGLLIFLPAHRGWSLDAWRKPELRVDAVPAWTLNLLRFQIGIVYFFAGVAKLNTDWLFRAQPLGIWLAARSDLPVVGHWLGQHWVAYAASWFGAVFDLSIVFFLLWKRSRALAYLAVIFFHLMTLLLFNIGMFPWVMMVAATVFFAPEWARRFISKANIQHPTSNLQHPICFAENMTSCFAPCSPSTTSPRPSPPFHGGEGGREPWDHSSDAQYFELFYRAHPISAPTDRMRPGLLVALGIYATIQLALPLRSFFCTMPTGWSYAGFNCAWRVMIVEKTGCVEFNAFDPVSNRHWTIPIENYLTPRQEALMAQDPDLIRQMARHLAADLESRGFKQIQIHADAFATMNGRPSQRLIDPNVNLASRVPEGWIVPMVN